MATITTDDQGYITDIEGEIVDEPKALVVRDPEIERLSITRTPEDMVAMASRMATALADIVERQTLYTTIRSKKYPHVEAWMIIARMDNVVCREVPDGIAALEDGSYEATVELVRLSDGLVIGRGSALCGAAADGDWTSRPAHMKRSMAVTRATSRAFRQQYSWIMALAGYQPTPADEMPGSDTPPETGEVEELLGIQTREGTVRVSPKSSAAPTKLDVRQAPDGPWFGFALETAKGNLPQVFLEGDLAAAVLIVTPDPIALKGQWCRVGGKVYTVRQSGRATYHRMRAEHFETRDYKLPADEGQTGPGLFDAEAERELDGALT